MQALLIVIHIIICIALIMVVLLQTGKGAEMGAAFGGASQTVFGGAGPAPFLSKLTTFVAVVFMLTSLTLAYLSSHPMGKSVVESVKTVEQPVNQAPSDTGEGNLPTGNEAAAPAAQAPAQTQNQSK